MRPLPNGPASGVATAPASTPRPAARAAAILRNPKFRTFLVAWLAYVGFYLCRKNFSVIIPLLIHDEGIPKDVVAQSVFAFSCGYVFGQFVMGLLADRFGARPIAFTGMAISSCATAAMGFSGGRWLLYLQILNGLAQASGWASLVKLMAGWFPKTGRGVVMAWWSTNYVAGGFLATLVATLAVGEFAFQAHSWRWAMWTPAALLFGIGLLFFALARELPHDRSLPTSVSRAGFTWSVLHRTIRNPGVRLISVSYLFIKLLRYSLFFWLPLYLTEELRYTATWAGYTSSILELAGIVGVLTAGYASDKLWRSRRLPVASWMLAALAISCLLQPFLKTIGPLSTAAGIALLGIFVYGPDTLISGATTQDVTSWDATGAAVGFVDGVGSIGQLLSPLVVNLSVAHWGWSGFFRIAVVVASAGSAILALGAKKLKL